MAENDPGARRTGYMVWRLESRHLRTAESALQPLGLSVAQCEALRHLHDNPDASLHELAQLTFQTDQSMGTLAGRMRAAGLIERVPGPGRAVRHRLTAKGERLREEGGATIDTVLRNSLASLGERERKTFDRLLLKVLGDDAPTL